MCSPVTVTQVSFKEYARCGRVRNVQETAA
jgi:hypothetical protein